MPTPLDVLDMIAAEPGKDAKRQIMRDHDTPELRKLLTLAVSPYINFGVQKLPEPGPIFMPTVILDPMSEFFDLADKLATRKLTGNAAKNALQAFFMGCDGQMALHFGGVLTKKLRCGVDSAVNDVWPNTIPEFKCALADEWEDIHKSLGRVKKYIKYPMLQSCKLDGMRFLAINEGYGWGLFSREGRPVLGMVHLLDELEAYADPNFVYDGEFYSHDVVMQKGFPFLIGLLKRENWDLDTIKGKKRDEVASKIPWRDQVAMHMFDRISLSDWHAMESREVQFSRLAGLKGDVADMRKRGSTHIHYVKHHIVHSYEEFITRNQEYLTDGFEGSMLKDPNGFYKFGRGPEWIKFKLFRDAEFEITGCFEGEGKWSGSLGGFTMKTEEGSPFKCGGGRCSMEDRNDLWSRRSTLVGQKATVRFFEYTDTANKVPRLPTFYVMRDYE